MIFKELPSNTKDKKTINIINFSFLTILLMVFLSFNVVGFNISNIQYMDSFQLSGNNSIGFIISGLDVYNDEYYIISDTSTKDLSVFKFNYFINRSEFINQSSINKYTSQYECIKIIDNGSATLKPYIGSIRKYHYNDSLNFNNYIDDSDIDYDLDNSFEYIKHFSFSKDGYFLFVYGPPVDSIDTGSDYYKIYSLNDPFDLTNYTSISSSLSIHDIKKNIQGSTFLDNGTNLLISFYNTKAIYHFEMTENYNLSTISFVGSYSLSPDITSSIQNIFNINYLYDSNYLYFTYKSLSKGYIAQYYYNFGFDNATYTEPEPDFYNLSINLQDTDSNDLTYSVNIDGDIYSGTGEIITDIFMNDTYSFDLNFYNISLSTDLYKQYDNINYSNQIFTIENYSNTYEIDYYYKQPYIECQDINTSDIINNCSYYLNEILYETNGTNNININITTELNYNFNSTFLKDEYKYYNDLNQSLVFNYTNYNYILYFDSYYNNITLYAYDLNNSEQINNFSVIIDGNSYSTSTGTIKTNEDIISLRSEDLYYYNLNNNNNIYQSIIFDNIIFDDDTYIYNGSFEVYNPTIENISIKVYDLNNSIYLNNFTFLLNDSEYISFNYEKVTDVQVSDDFIYSDLVLYNIYLNDTVEYLDNYTFNNISFNNENNLYISNITSSIITTTTTTTTIPINYTERESFILNYNVTENQQNTLLYLGLLFLSIVLFGFTFITKNRLFAGLGFILMIIIGFMSINISIILSIIFLITSTLLYIKIANI